MLEQRLLTILRGQANASLGIAHSPLQSSLRRLPGTVAGSTSKVRQNDALAAMTFWLSDRKSSGSFDDTTTASVLAASKMHSRCLWHEEALKGLRLTERAITRQERRRAGKTSSTNTPYHAPCMPTLWRGDQDERPRRA